MNKVKFRFGKKGYFTAIILAILILTLLGILAQQVVNHQMENETIEQLIITKHLTEERSNFEYNLKNTLQSFLDTNVYKTLDQNQINFIADNLLILFLQKNNFPDDISNLLINSVLNTDITNCDLNVCVHYNYTILNQLKKTIHYENKSVEIKIPANYAVINDVVT